MSFEPRIDHNFFPKKTVIVHLTTGGTIDTRNRAGGGRRPEGGLSALQDVSSFLHIRLITRGSFSLDSSNIGPDELKTIYKGVVQGLNDHRQKPICITHGTDTIETTAQVLSFSLNPYLQSPIVLFGSHSSPDAPGSDAAQNFFNSLLVCGNTTTPPFVYVVFGNDIHLGSLVQKAKTMPREGAQYFVSRGRPVGHIKESGQVIFTEKFLDWAAKFQKKRSVPPPTLNLGEVSMLSALRKYNPKELNDKVPVLLSQIAEGKHPAIVLAGEYPSFAFRDAYEDIRQAASQRIIIFGQSLPEDLGAVNLPEYLTPEQMVAKAMVAIGNSFPFNATSVIEQMTHDMSGEIELGKPTAVPCFEILRVGANTSADDIHLASTRIFAAPGYGNKYLIIEGLGDGHLRLVSEKSGDNVHPLSSERIALYANQMVALISTLVKDATPNETNKLLLTDDELEFYSELMAEGKEYDERTQQMFSTILTLGQEQVKAIGILLNAKFLKDMNLPDIRKVLITLLQDEVKVDRLIRDALIDSSKHLQEIASAIDSGISVLMMTRVPLSQPNMDAYDIGQMLKAVGVEEASAVTLEELEKILELRVSGQFV